MRFYENPLKTSENREKQRGYYIPKGSAEFQSLNGVWKFAYFDNMINIFLQNYCQIKW